MIGEPHWFARPVTKPGYGEPEPVKPVSSMDSPENVTTCLSCTLPKCRMGLSVCPLYGKGPPAKKDRRAVKSELMERDKVVRDLVAAGWEGADICKKLGIGRSALKASRQRLRSRGEIT